MPNKISLDRPKGSSSNSMRIDNNIPHNKLVDSNVLLLAEVNNKTIMVN